MKTCGDCGTKMSGGICPNCNEELFIFENQYDDLPERLSDEFIEKVKEQKSRRKRNDIRP